MEGEMAKIEGKNKGGMMRGKGRGGRNLEGKGDERWKGRE